MVDEKTPPHENEGGEFEEEWAWYKPRRVLSDRKLRYPPEIQEEICDWDAPKGASVCWNYDQSTDWIVISEQPIQDPDYQFAARNVLEQPEGDYTKIRARDELPSGVLDQFYKDNYLIYLARHEMLDDNPSTWLLQRSDLIRILPGKDSDTDLKKALMRNPSFFSPI